MTYGLCCVCLAKTVGQTLSRREIGYLDIYFANLGWIGQTSSPVADTGLQHTSLECGERVTNLTMRGKLIFTFRLEPSTRKKYN